MKILFTLFLSCFLCSSFAQTWSSNCTATPLTEAIYRNDAYKLAIKRVAIINSNYKDSVDIPLIYRDSIARVLYAIHNLPASLLKDTIVNLFGFSNFATNYPYYEVDSFHMHNVGVSPTMYYSGVSLKRFTMAVPDTTTWAAQWQAGNFTNTNNPSVNALAIRYGVSAQSVTPSLSGNRYIIQAIVPGALNIPAVFSAFNNIIGSQACSFSSFVGDGNAITLDYQADGIAITYYNACGDCPAGCTWGRKWTFKVNLSDCAVTYLGGTNAGSGTNPYNPSASLYTCTRGPVLPIAFENITGWLQNGQAVVNWKVLTQVNVWEYLIERSDNGISFYTAGKVLANSLSVADYTWKDIQPVNRVA